MKMKQKKTQKRQEHQQRQKHKRQGRERNEAKKRKKTITNRLKEIGLKALGTIHMHATRMSHMIAGEPCKACGYPATSIGVFIPEDSEEYGGVAGKVRAFYFPVCDSCNTKAENDEDFMPAVAKMYVAENTQFDNRVPGCRGLSLEEIDQAFESCIEDEVHYEHDDEEVIQTKH
jgi:hypothetical protein